MTTRKTALEVKHVSKDFYLPHEQQNSIKSAIVGIFKKKDKDADIQHALKDISFEVKEGEFFGILGRNGSGKSTMLKILAEIYQPTRGLVRTKGKLVPFIELGVGFNPELTGRENVYLNGALLGFSRREIDARYKDIVAFAELEEFMDQKLKNYSSGMQVRLAFSVATHAEADILVVDEVLAVGDADFQRKCYDFFKSLKKTGKTVIFVTHDMNAVREYCDRAILINNGNITHSGPADKVANEYLKLFNSRRDGENNTEGNRWGNGSVEFTETKVQVADDTVTLELEVTNRQGSVEGLDIGIDFFDQEDHLVCGYQYIYDHHDGFKLNRNETRYMILEFPNTFGNKEFNVTLNIKAAGGNTICDYWQKALSFRNSYSVSQYFPLVSMPNSVRETTDA